MDTTYNEYFINWVQSLSMYMYCNLPYMVIGVDLHGLMTYMTGV